jgi:hypothetical protein
MKEFQLAQDITLEQNIGHHITVGHTLDTELHACSTDITSLCMNVIRGIRSAGRQQTK